MASLSTCHLGLWLGWQILLNLVKHGELRLNSQMGFYQRLRAHYVDELLKDFAESHIFVEVYKGNGSQSSSSHHKYDI